jgi:hypothetical protein
MMHGGNMKLNFGYLSWVEVKFVEFIKYLNQQYKASNGN